MTTNQTIDGVPRDYVLRLTPEAHSVMLGMVEHCLNVRACMGMDEGFKDFDTEEEHDFVKELRALLDAPDAPVAPCAIADAIESAQWPNTSIGNKVLVAAAITELRKATQSDPLKIGHGVTVRNIGFGCDEERKPYLVFADNGNLTEVNLVDVSMISKLRSYTVPELEELGVQVEQPAPVAVVLPPEDNGNYDYGGYNEGHKDGWNACLDEVTRLNMGNQSSMATKKNDR